jgi:hypothetical protein
MVVLNMDENDDVENCFLQVRYDFDVDVPRVHQRKNILHYMKTNDKYTDEYSLKQQVYVELFHIVNNLELYMVLNMNVVGQLNRQRKNEEVKQQ